MAKPGVGCGRILGAVFIAQCCQRRWWVAADCGLLDARKLFGEVTIWILVKVLPGSEGSVFTCVCGKYMDCMFAGACIR